MIGRGSDGFLARFSPLLCKARRKGSLTRGCGEMIGGNDENGGDGEGFT